MVLAHVDGEVRDAACVLLVARQRPGPEGVADDLDHRLDPARHRAALAATDESAIRRLGSVGQPVPGIEIEIRWNADHLIFDDGQSMAHLEIESIQLSCNAPATTEKPQVILADNGSTDGSPEAADAAHDHVRLLRTGANLGYGGAINYAAARLDLDAIDFLLDKLRNTKSNSEFFDSMNT